MNFLDIGGGAKADKVAAALRIILSDTNVKAVLFNIYGVILTPGRRTVAAALRVVGLGDEQHFTNYHRVLNRDHWSPWVLSQILLSMIIQLCLPADAPLTLLIDETLERRRGRQIRYKGWFYDAVRSTAHNPAADFDPALAAIAAARCALG